MGLDPLIREAVARDLGQLLDERPPYSYLAAAESVGRITDHVISHGVKTFGPIVILAPAADAIAAVVARTVANISPWDWSEDEDDDLEHMSCAIRASRTTRTTKTSSTSPRVL